MGARPRAYAKEANCARAATLEPSRPDGRALDHMIDTTHRRRSASNGADEDDGDSSDSSHTLRYLSAGSSGGSTTATAPPSPALSIGADAVRFSSARGEQSTQPLRLPLWTQQHVRDESDNDYDDAKSVASSASTPASVSFVLVARPKADTDVDIRYLPIVRRS